MIKVSLIILCFILNVPSLAWATELSVVVVGLFRDQAVVEINNTQRLLKVGKTSPEGVTLISANSTKAVLEVNGERKTYQLGQKIRSNFAATKQAEVNLWPTNGMYLTAGSINGFSVDFLVDTGAYAIALNAATAQRIGINYLAAKKVLIKTASDMEVAYEVNLDSVQIGDITLHNIRATVLDSEEPQRALLGMSFLNKLEMVQTGEKMKLKQKY